MLIWHMKDDRASTQKERRQYVGGMLVKKGAVSTGDRLGASMVIHNVRDVPSDETLVAEIAPSSIPKTMDATPLRDRM